MLPYLLLYQQHHVNPVMNLALQVVELQVDASDQMVLGVGQGTRKALKMSWYVGSLVNLPQLSEGLIYTGGMRMKAALLFMHSKGLVHMDVKLTNILVDHEGAWFLSDFGSSTMQSEPVWSFTPVRWVQGMCVDQPFAYMHSLRCLRSILVLAQRLRWPICRSPCAVCCATSRP